MSLYLYEIHTKEIIPSIHLSLSHNDYCLERFSIAFVNKLVLEYI